MGRQRDVLLRRLRQIPAENQRRTAHRKDRHHHLFSDRRQPALSRRSLRQCEFRRNRHLQRPQRQHVQIGPQRWTAQILELIPAAQFEQIGPVVVPGVWRHPDHVAAGDILPPAAAPDILRPRRETQQHRAGNRIQRLPEQRHMVRMLHHVIELDEIHRQFFGEVLHHAPVIGERARMRGVGRHPVAAPRTEVVGVVDVARPEIRPLDRRVPFERHPRHPPHDVDAEFDAVLMAAVGESPQPVRKVHRRRHEPPIGIQVHVAELPDPAQPFVARLIAVGIPGGVEAEVFVSGRLQLLHEQLQIGQRLLLVDRTHITVETVPARGGRLRLGNQHRLTFPGCSVHAT